MSDLTEESEKRAIDDPSATDLLQLLFMQLQRIYDVQLLLLREQNSSVADVVDDKHSKFEFIGSMPFDVIDNE